MVCYIIKFFLIVLLILPFYLLFRKPLKRSAEREIALGAFILFILALLALALDGTYSNPIRMIQDALTRLSDRNRINLIPFHSIRLFFVRFRFDAFMINIVGNIVMFVPWGFGLPLLWKKRQSFLSAVFFSALLPLFIETVQLFIQRSVDVDDLILNFAGGLLGAALYFLIRKRTGKLEGLAR